jgi:hypothetical protein
MEHTFDSKRFSSRLVTTGDVYVCWGCVGYDDTSRILDLSSGGLFVQTRQSKPMGARTSLHFLVEEIRAEAIVRHVKPGRGLGLEFTAVREEDRGRLADLLKRLRGFGLTSRFPTAEPGQQASWNDA